MLGKTYPDWQTNVTFPKSERGRESDNCGIMLDHLPSGYVNIAIENGYL